MNRIKSYLLSTVFCAMSVSAFAQSFIVTNKDKSQYGFKAEEVEAIDFDTETKLPQGVVSAPDTIAKLRRDVSALEYAVELGEAMSKSKDQQLSIERSERIAAENKYNTLLSEYNTLKAQYDMISSQSVVVNISTGDACDITSSTVRVSGLAKMLSSTSSPMTVGICYATDAAQLKTNGMKATASNPQSDGSFSLQISGLDGLTTYYYCTYVQVNFAYYYGEVKMFTTAYPFDKLALVDMGTTCKWATCNLGAASAKIGDLYAWGETSSRTSFNSGNYVGGNVADKPYLTDNDAAHKALGSYWRLPSSDDFQELLSNSSVEEENVSGTVYLKFTSKITGSVLYLPKTDYWTGDLDASVTSAKTFNGSVLTSAERYNGYYIRPVYGYYGDGIGLICSYKNLEPESVTIVADLEGNLSKCTEFGVCYTTTPVTEATLDGVSIKTFTINGDNKVEVEVPLSGLSMGTTYYYYIYAKTGNDCQFSEIHELTTPSKYPVAEMIDLGLPSGTLWASHDIGSNNERVSGPKFYWADATGESTTPIRGIFGTESIAGTKYDIATNYWGEGWRIPTSEEYQELYDNCDVESEYGGFRFISRKDKTKSIFFRASGVIDYNGVLVNENYCYRWTADHRDETPYDMWISYNYERYSYYINGKVPVRAVYGGHDPSEDEDPDEPKYDTEGETELAGKYVDIGLHFLVANCNLGASNKKETEIGKYYSWADLNPTTTGSFATYPSSMYEDINHFNKLGENKDIENFSGNPAYDAATAAWGGKWRTPTRQDIDFMIDVCTWEWETREGVEGYKVTGPNGKSVFIPVGGYLLDGSNYGTDPIVGLTASYWTSTLMTYPKENKHAEMQDWAFLLTFTKMPGLDAGTPAVTNDYRYVGRLIRPVRDK